MVGKTEIGRRFDLVAFDPRGLSYADAMTGFDEALYSSEDWPQLTDGLRALARGTDADDLLELADQYVQREIHTGVQGELYTEILDGVTDWDQVVTFGSFFIDAEHKLKGTEQVSPPSSSGSSAQ